MNRIIRYRYISIHVVRFLITATILLSFLAAPSHAAQPNPRPNIILIMADDLGYGDVGFLGNKTIRTPHLDAMAKNSMVLTRFYSAAPVCSPTRGSCLTGRHPYRYGVFSANVGHMPDNEITLGELLRSRGYATGHFGKWHLGTLTTTVRESNRGGPRGVTHFAPPWKHGYDVCFSTEAKVPTFDPMINPKYGKPYGTFYWNQPGVKETKNLDGDDSRIIMDRALPFIRKSVESKKPFHAVIWFHTPHLPVVAGVKHLKLYQDAGKKAQHYYGCITAMDEQIGRLRAELRKLGVAENTLIFFCSDNGPEGRTGPGLAGGFRGRKRSLLEGGVRVPALIEWPDRIKPGKTNTPLVTSDYLPSVLPLVGLTMPDDRPLDGIDMFPLLAKPNAKRPRPIGFQSASQRAWNDNQYVLYSKNKGKSWVLYDVVADPKQSTDLSTKHADVVARMQGAFAAWQQSCLRSLSGGDYRKKQ